MSTIIGVAAAGEEIKTRPFQLVTGRFPLLLNQSDIYIVGVCVCVFRSRAEHGKAQLSEVHILIVG